MTDRLYYTDAYLRDFTAHVVGQSDDGSTVAGPGSATERQTRLLACELSDASIFYYLRRPLDGGPTRRNVATRPGTDGRRLRRSKPAIGWRWCRSSTPTSPR